MRRLRQNQRGHHPWRKRDSCLRSLQKRQRGKASVRAFIFSFRRPNARSRGYRMLRFISRPGIRVRRTGKLLRPRLIVSWNTDSVLPYYLKPESAGENFSGRIRVFIPPALKNLHPLRFIHFDRHTGTIHPDKCTQGNRMKFNWPMKPAGSPTF